MKRAMFHIFLITTCALPLVSCNILSQIQRSTKIINENQCAIQQSTYVINKNSEAIQNSTHIIRANHEHVGLTNDAIKENLLAVVDSSQAVKENANLVKESSKTIGENQKVIAKSNAAIAKSAAIVERLSKPMDKVDLSTIYLFIGGGLLLFIFPWLIILVLGYRMNKNLRKLIQTLRT